MSPQVISVVAALIRDGSGRVLLVRKRGTDAFMQPGGKRDVGESDVAALVREINEELGCQAVAGSARAVGVFKCAAANEPGFALRAAVYSIEVEGVIMPRAEIDEALWVDPGAPPTVHLAPLTRDHVLPFARISQ